MFSFFQDHVREKCKLCPLPCPYMCGTLTVKKMVRMTILWFYHDFHWDLCCHYIFLACSSTKSSSSSSSSSSSTSSSSSSSSSSSLSLNNTAKASALYSMISTVFSVYSSSRLLRRNLKYSHINVRLISS